MRRFDEAARACTEALEFFTVLGDTSWLSDINIQFGAIAKAQGRYEEAVEHYLEALALSKETDDKGRSALVYNYLGGLYKTQKQYEKALENYEMALSLVRKIDLTRGISACLTNMADTHNLLKQYDKAIQYHLEALQLKRETNDKVGEARVLNSLGIVFNNLEEYNKAEEHFEAALSLAAEIGDDWLISAIEYGLIRSAVGKGNYRESIEMAQRLIKNVKTYADPDFELRIYRSLSQAYSEIGEFRNAYTYSEQVNSLSDSLYNEQIITTTNDLEAKYQNEQKNQEIALLESEKELQELQLTKRVNERNAIIALAIIMLLFAGLLYNQYRVKQKANIKLRELDRLKSNFFANISHEFRTPLTLIKGPIERLEQNPDEKLSMGNIKMIRRNTSRVLKLVNQLLDLSRVDEGSLKLEPTEGDVYKCLRAATSSFNSHAAQRKIDYRVRIPQTDLWASFDRDKLEKIVYNLISNAFKFSEDGALISVDATFGKLGLQMSVSDSGKGIPKEKLPFIFDRFYQVDSSSTKEEEGSGIGLSLSKDLVELMDGTITVSSTMGIGTTFTVQLPLQQIMTGETEASENFSHAISHVPTNQFEFIKEDKRDVPEILLVEDNADMRYFIKDHLIKDYRVKEAINGMEGLQMAKADSPDLVLTDLMMPKLDGIEFCKRLKTDVHTSHIPVIMLTAKAGTADKLEGLETGADDYLTKPFDADELLVRTKNLIEQRKKLRELFANKEIKIDPKRVTVTSVDQKFLEKVLELLEARSPQGDFGVPQMQEALAMSKSQLHRKLRALTNEAPGELLRNFRLKRAAQLLVQKSDTVTQVAYTVGFNDLSYFTKCFKELYGVVPSAY